MIPSVNFHLWEPCNMRCHFCFATFQDVKESILPKGHLPKEQAIEVVLKLAQAGFQKITFAGGEPTLCSWLPELIATAKNEGLTTMIVTNGTRLTEEFLLENQNTLDWIALSVDSLNDETNINSGRAILGKKPIAKQTYFELVDRIKSYGYGLKINTVVSTKNYEESMLDFMGYSQPSRWKIFQVLAVKGQNDQKIDPFMVSEKQFKQFITNHKLVANTTKIVSETNNQILGSYVMVDPAGRFFDDTTGKHIYSEPILEVGCAKAIQQMFYDKSKFEQRGGNYDWERTKPKVA